MGLNARPERRSGQGPCGDVIAVTAVTAAINAIAAASGSRGV